MYSQLVSVLYNVAEGRIFLEMKWFRRRMIQGHLLQERHQRCERERPAGHQNRILQLWLASAGSYLLLCLIPTHEQALRD